VNSIFIPGKPSEQNDNRINEELKTFKYPTNANCICEDLIKKQDNYTVQNEQPQAVKSFENQTFIFGNTTRKTESLVLCLLDRASS